MVGNSLLSWAITLRFRIVRHANKSVMVCFMAFPLFSCFLYIRLICFIVVVNIIH